jgi:hypothetical protein
MAVAVCCVEVRHVEVVRGMLWQSRWCPVRFVVVS